MDVNSVFSDMSTKSATAMKLPCCHCQ